MVAIARKILTLISALRGGIVLGASSSTESSCTSPGPLTPCSTNPVTPDGNEIVPFATIKCGDSIVVDTTNAPVVNSNGLSDCVTSSGVQGLWYKFEDPDTCFDYVVFHTCVISNSLDTTVQVWEDTECSGGAPACVTGNDDLPVCAPGQSMAIVSDANRRYYVLVTGREEAIGTFTMIVDCLFD